MADCLSPDLVVSLMAGLIGTSRLGGVGAGRDIGPPHHGPLLCRVPAAPASDVMTQEALNHRSHLVRHL